MNAELSKKLYQYKFGPNFLELEDDEKLKQGFANGSWKDIIKGVLCFPVKKQIPDSIKELITESEKQTDFLHQENKRLSSYISSVFFFLPKKRL